MTAPATVRRAPSFRDTSFGGQSFGGQSFGDQSFGGQSVPRAFLVGAALGAGVVVARIARRRVAPPDDRSGAAPLAPRRRSAVGVGAATRIPPPAREPAPLRALAGWTPPPPSHPLARAAAYVWAAPVSVVGLLAGLGALQRPTLREGVVVFAPARGLTGFVLRTRGFAAGTLGHVVVAVREPDELLFAHELVHTRHAERLGVLLAPVYLGLLAVYGYARHPLERAARAAAERVARARQQDAA